MTSFSSSLIPEDEYQFFMHTAARALDPPPPIEWCVESIFPRSSVSMLVGASGSKKTFLAIDLAVCVALGKPWLGHAVKQGPVLYIDEQSGFQTMHARFNAALSAHQADADTPLRFTSLQGFNLRNENSTENLMRLAESINASLIIFDSFTNLLQGANESSLGAVLPVLFNLRFMSEFFEAAVIVTQHTNHHGFFQGSSAISASMDLMLAVESDPSESLVQLHPLKSRFAFPAPFAARAHFEPASGGCFLSEEELPSDSFGKIRHVPPSGVPGLAQKLFLDLHQVDQLSFKDLCSHHPEDAEGSVRNAVQKLMTEGVILRADGGGRGKPASYTLAEQKELTNQVGGNAINTMQTPGV